MKRLIGLMLALFVVTGFAAAQIDLSKVQDGVYFAQDDKFSSSGWREQIVITVSGGKISAATWTGVSNLPGVADKFSHAAAGKYGMIKVSKIKAEWDAQAKATADYLVKTQDINFSKIGKDGKTDAISGTSMTVSEFYTLAKKALSSAPVAKGAYKSGWYYAEQPAFDRSGWKDSVLLTIVNGSIVDVVWNGISNKAGAKSKLVQSIAGTYKMNAKNGEWNVQAARVEQAIVAAGDPAKIALNKDGKTDAVSGVSITANAVSLAIEALKAAK
jgi:major membrane immunogen (membrane-anchored lipoprotein)